MCNYAIFVVIQGVAHSFTLSDINDNSIYIYNIDMYILFTLTTYNIHLVVYSGTWLCT